MRGDGSIYKRGRVYWYAYWVNGRPEWESLRTDDPEVAKKRARKIRDGVLSGTIFAASERRVTVGELLDDLEADHKANERAWAKNARYFINRLRTHFGSMQAGKLDTASWQRFQSHCRDELNLAPATIDRHGELLRRAYNLACKRTPPKVTRAPFIPLLRVPNARQGFVATPDFWTILKGVDDEDLRDYFEYFWWTGMRPLEIARLSWPMWDAETWSLRLAPKAAKTRQSRTIPCRRGPTHEIMRRRIARRRLDCPLIFHVGGKVVSLDRYMAAWKKACRSAGIKTGRKVEGGITPYDLRRAAIRNMKRAGVDDRTAMAISGHLTRATFDRYNITNEEDLDEALHRTAEYVAALPGGSWAKTSPPARANRKPPNHDNSRDSAPRRSRK